MRKMPSIHVVTVVTCMLLVINGFAIAQEETKTREGFPPPEGLTPLAPKADVWIDLKRKLVVADGRVAFQRGALEMFACPEGTKEHESLIAIHGLASHVHAGLLAVGARSGKPVEFQPEYKAATGTKIDILVLYHDENGKRQRARAQEWVRNSKTGEPLQHDWVFAGSGFWTDPSDGKRYYYADGGDFVCVSNFPTATLDLPIPSSQANDSLLFEANHEKTPPRGTPVRLVFIPRPDTNEPDTNEPDTNEPDTNEPETNGADSENAENRPPATETETRESP